MPNIDLIPESDRKEILFAVAKHSSDFGYGVSSNWRNLSLLNNIADGIYYDETSNSGLAKYIRDKDPELYQKLFYFFSQNMPEDWYEEDEN